MTKNAFVALFDLTLFLSLSYSFSLKTKYLFLSIIMNKERSLFFYVDALYSVRKATVEVLHLSVLVVSRPTHMT